MRTPARTLSWGSRIALLAAAGAALAARPALGAPRKAAAAPTLRASAAASAPVQADGIVNAITDQLWTEADGYWHTGRYEDDIGLSYIVIYLRPRFLEPYETASWLIDSNGRHAEAEQLLRRATVVRADNWSPWYELGQFLYNKKRYHEAIAPLQKAASMPDCWPKVLHTLAHAYQHDGDLARSVATWEQAKKKEPNDGAVDLNLKRARALLRDHH